MQFSKSQSIRIMQMWNDYGSYLDEIFAQMIKDFESNMAPNSGDLWFNAKQNVEYFAKKQALIDLKKILSMRYE